MKLKASELTTTTDINEILTMTKIGTWDWTMPTGKVIYSTAWANILGYTVDELPPMVDTWERMVLPEDLAYANKQIERHLSGEKPIYEAEFRMICKDGSIIWAQDKGKVLDYDSSGKPLRFVGVLQNVSRLKDTEQRLLENQETLDLALKVAELGTWDWDIPGNKIQYNDEYLRMLGYSQDEMNGSMEEWEAVNHPEDLPNTLKMLNAYLDGSIPKYECETRMKHKNGSYIWTRDVGRIVSHDADGNPTRIIGGHLNIDALKRSEKQLAETLGKLENHHQYLEKEIATRTKLLTEQGKMLWAVNDISRHLFSVNSITNIDDYIIDSIKIYCAASGRERVSLWKNKDNETNPFCSLIYEWSCDPRKNFSYTDCETLINQNKMQELLQNSGYLLSKNEHDALFTHTSWENISYEQQLPTFYKKFLEGKTLNCLVNDLTPLEKFYMYLQGIKSLLATPIYLNDKIWGFICTNNFETEELFSEVEEKMLNIVGFFLANSIEKVESEKKIRETEDHIKLMLNATPLCYNLWTADFRNVGCNDEAVRLFDLASQQEYLERFFELSPEYQPNGRISGELAKEHIISAFENGYCRFEWLHNKLDGTPIPAEITLVRIEYNEEYLVAGYTRDLREINELQAKENALRASRDEALLNSKAKSIFLANMSHEIRTPMNAISGLAEIILRESRGRQSAEHAMGIKSACDNLLNIINDILDISKIESGKLGIISSQYELSSLLNDVITISRMRLGNKPLMFITNIDSKLPAQLIGDEIRIKQILINLLSNAIKFTQNGHISLRVSGDMCGTKAELKFTVTDTGFGIKSEDLGLLFAEFERVNTTKNRSIEGTGLGLAISKRLCEMMDGNIDVQSTYGEGSTFTLTITQECPEYERLSTVTKEKSVLLYEPRELYLHSIKESIENLDCKCIPCINQSEFYDNVSLMPYDYILTSSINLKKVQALITKNNLSASIAVFTDYNENIGNSSIYTIFFPVNCLQLSDMLNGKKSTLDYTINDSSNYSFIAPTAQILIVDDNPVNLKVATGLMTPYQLVIDTAENGIEAVEKVKNKKYDLVFMDHMMPEMDGIDATIAIRELNGEYYQALPIIALTANALVGTREMFIHEGMNDFLAKPIEMGKLCSVLTKWLPLSKKIKVDIDDQTTSNSTDCEWKIDGINTLQGIMSVGGNKDDYLDILSYYYSDGEKKRSSLLHHFNQKDIPTFRIEIHSLKSTSATIGAVELSIMASKLEVAAQNDDLEFIGANIDKFLSALQKILKEIRPLVNNNADLSHKEDTSCELVTGDLTVLKDKIAMLYDAVELANIGKIENLLNQLVEFSWSAEIAQELASIKDHLAMFDYDAALECVSKLKAIQTK